MDPTDTILGQHQSHGTAGGFSWADDLRDRPCMKINASHDDVDRAAYYRTRSQLGTFHLYFVGSQWWIQYSIRWHHDAPDDLPLLRVPLQADRHGRARGSANMRETMWLRFP